MKITATAVLNLKQPHVSSHFTSKLADRSRLSIAGTSSLRVINELLLDLYMCDTLGVPFIFRDCADRRVTTNIINPVRFRPSKEGLVQEVR